ncbi:MULTISPECIES: hypothetical protein [Sphingobacterium]|jgi:hypothetical protein|uniref:Lipoprotein n=1 Tax=Sphingobacterium multivorum TaxID=28454 RepID=A0A2X2IZW5_SPHMU|nr:MULTISPECIES: hypothetical protein [Sphingobacterium]MDF2850850.1 hypothetical protein [Sphingobacterium multivorum]QRQ63717.1 hypothetical protein I6J33_12465 [Sphingobacterium multivorum]SPZ85691.1 Uncharacterised protein [Sphingobacterium multivorum]
MKKIINLGLLAFVLTTFTVSCGSAGKKKENGKSQSDSTSSKGSKKDQPNTGCD